VRYELIVIIFCAGPHMGKATSWNVAGSNPDEVIGFSNWPKPYRCTVGVGSTEPLTEISIRNLHRVKSGRLTGAYG
jgi:hypothetical protein